MDRFNSNPREGINFLVQKNLIQDTAEGICDFLSTTKGLSKRRLGEYFGRVSEEQRVAASFLQWEMSPNTGAPSAYGRTLTENYQTTSEAKADTV